MPEKNKPVREVVKCLLDAATAELKRYSKSALPPLAQTRPVAVSALTNLSAHKRTPCLIIGRWRLRDGGGEAVEAGMGPTPEWQICRCADSIAEACPQAREENLFGYE
jgi:hypothetical protein